MAIIDIDKWQEIFNSIRKHKLRTALTAFGVFWGIFMLVLLLGAGNGLKNSIEYSFKNDAINSIWLHRGTTSKSFNGLKEGRRIQFDNSDYDFLLNEFTHIEALTGRFYISGSNVTKYKDKALSFYTRAVHPGHKVLENTEVIKGRFINDRDLDLFNKVAVIGRVVRQDLMGDEDPIGKEIKIGDVVYTVVGEFFDSGGENEMRNIYVPITTAQKVYSGGDNIHQLMVAGGDLSAAEMAIMEEKIRIAMASRKQFDPEDRRALRVYNRAEDYQSFVSLFSAIDGIIWIVGIFSILAGVIGVSNIMLIIVKDRTKEIGIRKAIGATPMSIVSMILQESIFITGIAGYLGMLSGIGIIFAISGAEGEYFRHPNVDVGVIIFASAVLVVTGALAGLIPALQAARINPVVAMKN
jgi:putative ABC transport system permease protein